MTQAQVQHHALPRWFVAFQDTAGLSLLIVALMTINGVVYASGVVPDIERPQTWGLFGSIMFAAFFFAGAAMPGVALRAGAGIFLGEWYRRLACLLVSLMFFGLEVWCSITERSVNTITSPADRWLLAAIGQPTLPFSPTVLAISFAISLIVIVWGLVTGVSAQESAEALRQREELKTIRAQAKAERMGIYARGIGSAARATVDAAKQSATADEEPATILTEVSDEGADDEEPEVRPMRPRPAVQRGIPAGKMSAPQFVRFLGDNGVSITDEKARAIVLGAAGFEKVGTAYCADKRALMAVANRMIRTAQPAAGLVG